VVIRLPDPMDVLSKLFVVGLLLFLVVPTGIVIVMSFDSRGYFGAFPPPGLSLRWYDRLLSSQTFLAALTNSLLLGTSVSLLSLLISIPAAYFFTRYRFKGQALLMSVYMSPLVVPGTVIGVALLNFFTVLNMRVSFVNLMIGHLIITFPFALSTLVGALTVYDPTLEEAAMMLGTNRIQAFLKVTLPIFRAAVLASAIFVFSISFDEVSMSVFLTDPYTSTFPVTIFSLLRASTDLTIAAASTIFASLNVVLILVLGKAFGFQKVVGLR
jgi:putative spermidine/putrescine transport system permease protein